MRASRRASAGARAVRSCQDSISLMQVAGKLIRSLSRDLKLEFGERRCGFDTKYQSTEAPRSGACSRAACRTRASCPPVPENIPDMYSFIHLSIYLSIFIRPPISIHLFIHLSIYLSIYLPINKKDGMLSSQKTCENHTGSSLEIYSFPCRMEGFTHSTVHQGEGHCCQPGQDATREGS